MLWLFTRRALLLASLALPTLTAAEPFNLSARHVKAAHRPRRVIVQLDAADHRRINLPPAEWLKYIFTFPDEPGSQIDSIVFDIGLDNDMAVYPSKFLPPTHDRWIRAWQSHGFEWLSALIKECRKRNIEVIWNHRFSEVDLDPDANKEMTTLHPIKAAHPDWLIRCWWWQGLWNAAAPGLREFKVAQLRDLAENYDLDGIQIDFARHTPVLPPGHQWEQRDGVTELLRMTRKMLLDVENKRNKPILLGAKVPRTLEGCKIDGFDVAVWAKERLVDQLTLGSRSLDVDIEGFRKAVGPAIRLHPCYDDHHATDGYRFAPIEYLRGVAATWWKQGADAVTTFNFAVARPARAAEVKDALAPPTHQLAYHQIGDPKTMANLDRVYVVERRGGYPWAEGYFNRNDTAQLPELLSNAGKPSRFVLRIAEPAPKAQLRLILFNALPSDTFDVTLNGTILTSPNTDPTWKDPQINSPAPQPSSGGNGRYEINPAQKLLALTYTLDPATLRTGLNKVEIKIAHRGSYPINAQVQVEKIELATTYSRSTHDPH
ncbi:family 10 glycosylhydrolase [uncultured Paludibaculum sp.]|uniref:family 10 glycosylhydrolase n=1 Tax=uncultured Paludibaculum sp. TaxID=1765020 RepID=UPI002AAC3BB4|nr:family 10 glycosylhydrolase [uncultured Paludibaculum sp.]